MLEINKIRSLHKKRPSLQVSSQTSLWNQVRNSCFPNCEHQYIFHWGFFSDHSKSLKINMQEYKTVQTADLFHISLKGKRY